MFIKSSQCITRDGLIRIDIRGRSACRLLSDPEVLRHLPHFLYDVFDAKASHLCERRSEDRDGKVTAKEWRKAWEKRALASAANK